MGGKETIRYAVHHSEKIGLLDFLDLAESKRTNERGLAAPIINQYDSAPPCIQKILHNMVGEGQRNEALFNTVVYLRRAFPDDFGDRAVELNTLIFHKPMAKAELARTISSAGRPDYSYRCNEEVIRANCDKAACLASKYGITAQESEVLETILELPTFSDLVKYMTEPVRWEIKIDGHKVGNLSTASLLDWREMRQLIMEKLLRVVPMIKAAEWERILTPVMAQVRIIDTPDDASVAGVVRLRLKELPSPSHEPLAATG